MKRVKSMEFITPKARKNLNAADASIANLAEAIDDEEDAELRESYGHEAKRLDEQYRNLNTRYADSRKHGTADPFLKEEIKLLKRRAANSQQTYSKSSETKRQEREAEAREQEIEQQRRRQMSAREKQASQAKFDRQNRAKWEKLDSQYDSRTESHIYGHALPVHGDALTRPAPASHSNPNLAPQTPWVSRIPPKVYPPGHPMAAAPMADQPIMGRQSIEELDSSVAITSPYAYNQSLPPPRSPPFIGPKLQRNKPNHPRRTGTEPRHPMAPEFPQFGDQPDYEAMAKRQQASMSTPTVNYAAQSTPYLDYQSPGYNPAQASGSGALAYYGPQHQFQPGATPHASSSNLPQQRPPPGYGTYNSNNSPYGQNPGQGYGRGQPRPRGH
ncbi:hypothetical protein C8R46DRAFT_1142679 [Mycena filopes]|nr:hypothetical protein C8R46DRAFT_1142679 [Mycena filopes]